MTPPWVRRLLLAAGVVIAGVLLGAAGRASDYMAAPSKLAFALGVPWLSVCFAAGWCARARWEGALAGAAVLVIAVGAYYSLKLGVERRAGPRYAAEMFVIWGFFGALTGALFGFAGAVVRDGSPFARAAALGLLAGAFAGEGFLYLALGREHGLSAALLLGELSVGMLLPLAFARRREVFGGRRGLHGPGRCGGDRRRRLDPDLRPAARLGRLAVCSLARSVGRPLSRSRRSQTASAPPTAA